MTVLEPRWRKSSHSGGGDNCLQVRYVGGVVQVRDSEDPEPVQTYTRSQWDAFLAGVRSGEFELPPED
ncbi:DUF397 domain-containing protein [Catenulispora rubra]|uniref:DUF397 domain-containing protein n=1 Tax=Catenulispora rubra TaxID=280293 RepID=UPI0018922AC0|nr:DUF397 domain-containing protein [Catenulispora rubra]